MNLKKSIKLETEIELEKQTSEVVAWYLQDEYHSSSNANIIYDDNSYSRTR